MRQTEEHSVVLACVMACLDFLHGRRSLSSSLTMKGSFVLLSTVTWQQMLIFFHCHVITWQWMECICDNVAFLEAWIVASSRLMEFVVKCWLVVQQRCKYVILALLTQLQAITGTVTEIIITIKLLPITITNTITFSRVCANPNSKTPVIYR